MVKVIAEIGINHAGDIKLVKELIKTAKASGADAVKFQYRKDINNFFTDSLITWRSFAFSCFIIFKTIYCINYFFISLPFIYV